jgi:hypothetical protein
LSATSFMTMPRANALNRAGVTAEPLTCTSPVAIAGRIWGAALNPTISTSSPSSLKYPFSCAMKMPASDTAPMAPTLSATRGLSGAVCADAAGTAIESAADRPAANAA